MKNFKWILIFGAIVLVGCSPKTNDGITPSSPTYTQGFPDPLVIFNNYLASGTALNVYEYSPTGNTNASVTLSYDTTVTPQVGKANLLTGLISYNATTWVGFPILTAGSINITNNYSELTFYVQGAFGQLPAPALPVTTGIVSFNGLGVAMTPVTVTTAWQAVTLTVSGTLSGPAATELFVANFYSNTINAPVTTYFDQIQFQ